MADAAGGLDGRGPRRRWDVALSFAGAQREFAQQVASALATDGVQCFYDFDPKLKVELWGKHLAEHLPSVYESKPQSWWSSCPQSTPDETGLGWSAGPPLPALCRRTGSTCCRSGSTTRNCPDYRLMWWPSTYEPARTQSS